MSQKNYELQFFTFSVSPATFYGQYGEYRKFKWRIVIDGKELQYEQQVSIDDSESMLGRFFSVAQAAFEQAIKEKRKAEQGRLILDVEAKERAVKQLVSQKRK